MTRRIEEFVVLGRGPFPLDMLRYDQCWPASAEDVQRMDVDSLDRRALRTVRLRTINVMGPTTDRWESFLWKVV